jgi:hypothetical protein
VLKPLDDRLLKVVAFEPLEKMREEVVRENENRELFCGNKIFTASNEGRLNYENQYISASP